MDDRAAEILFDEGNAKVLLLLEGGEQSLERLAAGSGMSETDIAERLEYLFEAGILHKSVRNGSTYVEADNAKLTEIVESDGNFDAAVEGLTKMDSFLN